MKLETIEIRNYRSIFKGKESDPAFEMHLGDGVNAITGPNNVGKSNVFRALCLALDPAFTFDRSLDMPAQFSWSKPSVSLSFRIPEKGRDSKEQTLLRYLDAYERKVNPDLRKSYADEGIVKLRVTIEGGTEDSAGIRRQVFVAKGAGARSLTDDDDLMRKALNQFDKCLHFVMVSSGQSLESLMEGKFRDILRNVLRENLQKEYAAAADRREAYGSDLSDGLLQPLTERISKEVKDLFPEIKGVTLRPNVLDLDETLAKMRIEVADDARTDLADKGTGVRGGLIVAMLNHFAEVGKRSMLFAVEEPESFLHPAAQENLRDDLEDLSERSDVSLLVTTHSPYILSRQPEAKVFALSKDDKGRTFVAAEAEGAEPQATVLGGLFRDRLMVEWLDRAQITGSDAKLALVVEGYTDKAFAELALERAGRLDLLQGIEIKLASDGQASGAGGANLAVVQALLVRALSHPDVVVAALFDNDGPGKQCEQMLKEIGSKTHEWKPKKTLFNYRDVFDSNNAHFAFEAEDLWPDHLHESFKATCGHPEWLKRDEAVPNPDGGRQHDWAAAAKGALLEHMRKNVTADDCALWVELFELIRKGTGIGDPVAATSGAPRAASTSAAGLSDELTTTSDTDEDDVGDSGEARTAFLRAVMERIEPALSDAGFISVNMHRRGNYIRANFPSRCGLRDVGGFLFVKVAKDDARSQLVLDGSPTRAGNADALDALRRHLGSRVSELPSPVESWSSGIGTSRRALARSELRGGGYRSGSADDTAAWAQAQAVGWLSLLTAYPFPGVSAMARRDDVASTAVAVAPTSSSSDALGRRAAELGLEKIFGAVVAATERAGWPGRTYKNGVMATPPDNRTRHLVWIKLEDKKVPYVKVTFNTPAFAEFFPVSLDEVRSIGLAEARLTANDSADEVVDAIDRLAELILQATGSDGRGA